jgi:hypothetical protein
VIERGHARFIKYLQAVFRIFQHCPNARMLSGIWPQWALPKSFYVAVSDFYGSSLQGLLWEEGGNEYDMTPSYATPSFFEAFRSLRVLHLSLFKTNLPNSIRQTEQRPVLPRVEHLVLSTNLHTFTVAAALDLPTLCRVTLDLQYRGERQAGGLHNFLRVHGSNIKYLDVGEGCYALDISIFLKPNGCPNLRDFVYHIQTGPMSPPSQPHKSLRRIGLRGVVQSMIRDSVKRHFRSFNCDVFPALEVVRTIGFLVAQIHNYDYSYDPQQEFIRWVEEFEQDGIDLQDGEGVVWLRSEDKDTEMGRPDSSESSE